MNYILEEEILEHNLVSGGVIARKNENNGEIEILLIQRSKDDHWPLHWEIPRGKCDRENGNLDENIIKCLKREVKEETGLDIIPIKFIDKFDYISNGGKRKTTQFNFLCKIENINQKVKLSKEHDNFQWITYPGIIQIQVSTGELRNTIFKAMKMFEGVDEITVPVSYSSISIKESKYMKIFKLLKENEKTNNKKLNEMNSAVSQKVSNVMSKVGSGIGKAVGVAGMALTAIEAIQMANSIYQKYNMNCSVANPLNKVKRLQCKVSAMNETINSARRNLELCETQACREDVMIYIKKLSDRRNMLMAMVQQYLKQPVQVPKGALPKNYKQGKIL